jgi:hypothetical protein
LAKTNKRENTMEMLKQNWRMLLTKIGFTDVADEAERWENTAIAPAPTPQLAIQSEVPATQQLKGRSMETAMDSDFVWERLAIFVILAATAIVVTPFAALFIYAPWRNVPRAAKW